MSLLRMPRFERGGEQAFGERPGRGADDDRQHAQPARSRARRRGRRAPAAPTSPAAVPSIDMAPGVPGRTDRGGISAQVRVPTPCRFRWPRYRSRPRPAPRPSQSSPPRSRRRAPRYRRRGGHAGVRDGVPRTAPATRSSAMPSRVLRCSPMREVTAAHRKRRAAGSIPASPAHNRSPCRSRRPSGRPRPTPFAPRTGRGHHGVRRQRDQQRPGRVAPPRPADLADIDIAHSTAAADRGTETLSSSRIGTVSTARRDDAATIGAPTENHSRAGESIAARHHQQRNAPAAPPAIASAALPQGLLRGSRASRRRPRPTSVAAPSPTARMPHAAATMSGRAGKSAAAAGPTSGRAPGRRAPPVGVEGRWSRSPALSEQPDVEHDCGRREDRPPDTRRGMAAAARLRRSRCAPTAAATPSTAVTAQVDGRGGHTSVLRRQ